MGDYMSFLNRYKIIEITKQIFSYDLDNILDEQKIIDAIDNIDEQAKGNINEAINEPLLLCYLFKNYKYYEIIKAIKKCDEKVRKITTTSKVKSFSLLFHGYLLEIEKKISKRCESEVLAHISLFAKIYYQNGFIDATQGKNILNHNLLNPYELFSTNTVTNMAYEQQEMFVLDENKDGDIIDTTSKNIYNTSIRIKNTTKELISKNFNENSFRGLQFEILKIINLFSNNLELLMMYTDAFDDLNKKVRKQWKNNINDYPLLQLKN